MSVDFSDPQIWVAFAFILFFICFGKLVWRNLSSFLDKKIIDIKNEINEAQTLHKDAKELLAIESKKLQDLDMIVKEIIDNSKNKSYELLLENKKKIESQIEKLEKESLDKIKVIQNRAMEEIKLDIVNSATFIAENIIKNKLSEKNQKKIMDNSINETKSALN